jgi:glycosyltransferase involved in cell wall biosynthesis
MRFLHFSTSDGPGGAGKAAFRLHTALSDAKHSSRMLVRRRGAPHVTVGRGIDDPQIQTVPANPLVAALRRLQKHLPFARPPRVRFTFNHDLEPGIRWRRALDDLPWRADVLCLHWVADFLTSKSIRAIQSRLGCPVLWAVMDQEPVTGGCHYSFGCRRFENECGECPLLERPSAGDCSRQVLLRKRRYLADLPITFVAPTSWVEDRIRRSALFGGHRVERIALPIDTQIFFAGDRSAARDELNLPRNKTLVFFGSSYLHEPRKGGAYLVEALQRLHGDLSRSRVAPRNGGNNAPGRTVPTMTPDDVLMLVAGRNSDEITRQLPFAVREIGYLEDERNLAKAYRAADLFVCPSIEDAGPMMIPEAMLCGTPVVAFDTGGAPDLIVEQRTGYLAPPLDAAALAGAIHQAIVSQNRESMGRAAAQAARLLHDPLTVVERYVALVAELKEAQQRVMRLATGAAA